MKSARHHYYLLFSSIRGKLSRKNSALVWYEILRQFVKALPADDMYSHSKKQNLQEQLQTPLSQKQKTFFEFSFAFLKSSLNF